MIFRTYLRLQAWSGLGRNPFRLFSKRVSSKSVDAVKASSEVELVKVPKNDPLSAKAFLEDEVEADHYNLESLKRMK